MTESPFFQFLLREINELRRRLVICLVALALVSALLIGAPSWEHSWALQAMSALQARLLPAGVKLVYTNPLEPMAVALKASVSGAFLICLPLILWHFIAFTLPAFAVGLRSFYLRFTLLSVAFLGLGLFLTFHFMLPLTLKMLLAYGEAAGGQPMLTFERFYSFCILVLMAFALPFETPLVMGFLQRFNIVEAATFRSIRWKAYGVIMIVSQFVTPDPLLTPTIFCLVSFGLYEIGIWMGKLL